MGRYVYNADRTKRTYVEDGAKIKSKQRSFLSTPNKHYSSRHYSSSHSSSSVNHSNSSNHSTPVKKGMSIAEKIRLAKAAHATKTGTAKSRNDAATKLKTKYGIGNSGTDFYKRSSQGSAAMNSIANKSKYTPGNYLKDTSTNVNKRTLSQVNLVEPGKSVDPITGKVVSNTQYKTTYGVNAANNTANNINKTISNIYTPPKTNLVNKTNNKKAEDLANIKKDIIGKKIGGKTNENKNTDTPKLDIPESEFKKIDSQKKMYDDFQNNQQQQVANFNDYQQRQQAINSNIYSDKIAGIRKQTGFANREARLATEQANRNKLSRIKQAESARNRQAGLITGTQGADAGITGVAAQELAAVADKFNISMQDIDSDTAQQLVKVQSQYNNILRKLANDETLTDVEKEKMAEKLSQDLFKQQESLLANQQNMSNQFYQENRQDNAAAAKAQADAEKEQAKAVANLDKRGNAFMEKVNKTLQNAGVMERNQDYWNNVRQSLADASESGNSELVNEIIDRSWNDLNSNPKVKNYYEGLANKKTRIGGGSSNGNWMDSLPGDDSTGNNEETTTDSEPWYDPVVDAVKGTGNWLKDLLDLEGDNNNNKQKTSTGVGATI